MTARTTALVAALVVVVSGVLVGLGRLDAGDFLTILAGFGLGAVLPRPGGPES